MHSTSDNISLTPYNANEVVNELFESLSSKQQDNLETSMRGSDFIFDSVQLMYYKCHKVSFKRGGSLIVILDKKQKSNNKSKMKMTNVFNTQQLLH